MPRKKKPVLETGERMMLMIQATGFKSGAILEKMTDGSWECVESGHLLSWMLGMDGVSISQDPRMRGWSFDWLAEPPHPHEPGGIPERVFASPDNFLGRQVSIDSRLQDKYRHGQETQHLCGLQDHPCPEVAGTEGQGRPHHLHLDR